MPFWNSPYSPLNKRSYIGAYPEFVAISLAALDFCVERAYWSSRISTAYKRYEALVVQALDSDIDKYYGNQLRHSLDRDLYSG